MPHLVSCEKIWSKAQHNAFTDLIFHQNSFYCCFREGEHHAGGTNGKIRLIGSANGKKWKSVALLTKKGIDLRDPMLSTMPDGRLMLNMGGTKWEGDHQLERASYVSFSEDAVSWTPPKKLRYQGEWIWRVSWHRGKGYAASYTVDTESGCKLSLVVTTDGIKYKFLKRFDLPHHPNETTLRFLNDDTMVALARTRGPHGLIGHSKPPYQNWTWFDTHHRLGGPNFVVLDPKNMWACSRKLIPLGKKKFDESVVLAKMGLNSYEPMLKLPSGDDSSYAGMVAMDEKLYVSYYSSHEGKSRIYFACVTY